MLKVAKVSAYQQETEWSCSAATLKAAAMHWGVDLTEKVVIKAVGARKGRGAETDEIVAGAKKLGFESWEKSFKDLSEAKAMLKRGVPIIADFQSFNHPGKGHYVLIVGFKPGKGFIIMDPNTKGKTAVDNWRILSEAEMEKKWWDRAMAPPHKLMSKWGVMIMPKQKEKTASFTYGNALNRAKGESRAAQHAYGGKYAAGDDAGREAHIDKVLEKGPASPRWGAVAGSGAGMALGSIAGAQAGVIGQKVKEYAKGRKAGRLSRAIPKSLRNLGRIPRRLDAAMRGGTYGAAAGIPLGAAMGYKLMKGADKEKKANGDMMEYFQKHPKKLEEYKARQAAKGKTKKANDPIKKKLKVQGITIWLEWLKGEERTYYNHDPLKVNSKGKLDYKTKMKADYGYVPKRYDADGEDLDIYLGDNHESTKVFILKQIRPSDGSFDEHKIMLGYDNIEEAKKSYLAHMPKKYLGSIRATNIAAFKKEFLMGKARFKKKADARLIGAGLGGALGYVANKSRNKNEDEAGKRRSSAILPVGLGAWSGADVGGLSSAARQAGKRGQGRMAAKYLRNPMLLGALLAGGIGAGGAYAKKKSQERKGEAYTGQSPLASGAINALHGAAFGGHLGAFASQLPGAGVAARAAKAPKWGKGAKTQKDFKKSRQAQARKHHPDIGGDPEVMKRVNSEAQEFMDSAAFKNMPKEASLNAFAAELRMIMEANARR